MEIKWLAFAIAGIVAVLLLMPADRATFSSIDSEGNAVTAEVSVVNPVQFHISRIMEFLSRSTFGVISPNELQPGEAGQAEWHFSIGCQNNAKPTQILYALSVDGNTVSNGNIHISFSGLDCFQSAIVKASFTVPDDSPVGQAELWGQMHDDYLRSESDEDFIYFAVGEPLKSCTPHCSEWSGCYGDGLSEQTCVRSDCTTYKNYDYPDNCQMPKPAVCGNQICEVGEDCWSSSPCHEDCGVCSICGNSIIEGNEECDDGNVIDGDGCSKSCLKENGNGDDRNGIPVVAVLIGGVVIFMGMAMVLRR